MDGADEGVAEGAVGEELDLEGQTVLLGQSLVDGEFHRKVPLGVAAAVFVHLGGCTLKMKRITGERNDGVNIHLGKKINILYVFC